MKLQRLTHLPGSVADFYEAALTSLGALCERTWHDRLEVVAEGNSSRLWNDTGALHEIELWFPPSDDTAPREAAKEVFPGCPLTFQLAESLRPVPLALERVVLAGESAPRAPAADVAEKLWRAQFPETNRWRLAAPFVAGFHFSLLALVRCEIQAIDQHWSLRRLAVSLSDGEPDEALARDLSLVQLAVHSPDGLVWPTPEPGRWQDFLRVALEQELAADLAAIRARQELYLRRELDRVDDYFEHYERELAARSARGGKEATRMKRDERLAAARAEHARRRADQVARHEIRVRPQLEALLLVAGPAWRTTIAAELAHQARILAALFVPRSRRWIVSENADGE